MLKKTMLSLAVLVASTFMLSACGGGDDGDICSKGRPLYGSLQDEYDARCPNGPDDVGK